MTALGTAMPTLRDVLAARAVVYRYLKAKKVAVDFCGGNVSIDKLRAVLGI